MDRDQNSPTETEAIYSFAPIVASNSSVIIVGSMPGEHSLAAQQYYAHPRNAFWKIIQGITGIEPNAPYKDRVKALMAHGIAVWDVLKSCERSGSLDSAIRKESIEINDFRQLFDDFRRIETVVFNGGTSERYYKTLVRPTLNRVPLEHHRMPSTSPAFATLTVSEKILAWRTIAWPSAAADQID